MATVERAAAATLDNVTALFRLTPFARVAFITLTFANVPKSPHDNAREAQKRFRKFMRLWLDHLKAHTGDPALRPHWLAVLQRSRSGRLHYHLIADTHRALDGDRFDWDAYHASKDAQRRGDVAARVTFSRAYGRSSGPGLRALWRTVSRIGAAAGFGRCEALPIRKAPEAAAKYVAAYLDKHNEHARERDKRAKRTLCSPSVRRTTQHFAWHSKRSSAWRAAVANCARDLGLEVYGELKERLGPRWAWFLHEQLCRDAAAILDFHNASLPVD